MTGPLLILLWRELRQQAPVDVKWPSLNVCSYCKVSLDHIGPVMSHIANLSSPGRSSWLSGTDLLSQLSVGDQREVDSLNDEIKSLNQQNKQALADRIKLEGEKNKIENLLSGNLMRKRERLVAELQEISVEDRKQKLETCLAELQGTEMSIETNKARIEDFESQIESLNREQLSKQSDLEDKKNKERDFGDKINTDTKALEKMTNKQSLLLKKVGVVKCRLAFLCQRCHFSFKIHQLLWRNKNVLEFIESFDCNVNMKGVVNW